jgi:hypothetical protein
MTSSIRINAEADRVETSYNLALPSSFPKVCLLFIFLKMFLNFRVHDQLIQRPEVPALEALSKVAATTNAAAVGHILRRHQPVALTPLQHFPVPAAAVVHIQQRRVVHIQQQEVAHQQRGVAHQQRGVAHQQRGVAHQQRGVAHQQRKAAEPTLLHREQSQLHHPHQRRIQLQMKQRGHDGN